MFNTMRYINKYLACHDFCVVLFFLQYDSPQTYCSINNYSIFKLSKMVLYVSHTYTASSVQLYTCADRIKHSQMSYPL